MQDYRALARQIPAMCVGHRTRVAARALSRHYHAYFRGLHLTASQFGILVSLSSTPDQSIVQLGGELGMEPTTMVRAVQQLERRGLVVAEGGRGRQRKRSTLTPEGRRVLQRGIARWQVAHDAVVDALGGHARARAVLAAIGRLEEAASSLMRVAAAAPTRVKRPSRGPRAVSGARASSP